jgi:hypothetical protein
MTSLTARGKKRGRGKQQLLSLIIVLNCSIVHEETLGMHVAGACDFEGLLLRVSWSNKKRKRQIYYGQVITRKGNSRF